MFDEWGNPITGKYKVNPGDNLTKISNELEVPIDSLVSFNRLSNPDNIKVGQTLLFRKEPGMLDNISRLIFGENEDSKEINNQINKNILNLQKPQEEDPEYVKLKKTIFKNKDINNFARVMSSIYSHEMRKRGLPLHNIDNLVKQDALESNYGISTRGNGYNLGGVKVFNDKEKLGTLYKDGFYYRNFKDLGDYVNYKLNLLENDYGGVISAPAEEFIDRIHGNNPNKKVYSGNKKHYINSFKGMISLSSALNKLRTSSNIQFKQYGGILLSPLDYLPDYSVKDIKVDPSIFNSWEAIKSDYIEPTITTKDESLFNLSDYILATQPNYIIKNKKSTKEEKEKEEKEEELSKEEKSNNVGISNSIPNSYKYSSKAQWVKELSESYKRAGITNPNALKYLIAQDALESGWGKSAQGNFNFGNLTTGSSWKGDYVQGRDKDANGNPISQKFRSYNSMDEYTRDKVEFLTRLYDFNQNDNLQTFISKLTGNNKGHRRYAEARNYGESLTKVFQSLISKHQEGGVLLFGNSETSEMLTYKMPDGSIKTVPNTKAGFVSGTDPVGQVIVEGAILNKPLSWAFGKAINWAKGLLNKRNISVGNFSKGEEVINNSEKIISKEDLPSYTIPNWQGDAVELTKDRLRNGGFERLEQSTNDILNNPFEYNLKDSGDGIKFISPKYSSETRNKILKSNPKNFTSKEVNRESRNVGYGKPNGSLNNSNDWGIFNDAPSKYSDNPQIRSDINAHEFSHWIYYPKYGPSEKYFNYDNLPSSLRSHGEFAGRGTQLKNYFGLKEGEELTGDMLKYAKENFAKDRGYDNHMIDFLNRIKDFDKVAKWLNMFSASIIPITIYNGNNK